MKLSSDTKATIAGVGGAIANAWEPIVLAMDGGPIDWDRLILSGFIAAIGYIANKV